MEEKVKIKPRLSVIDLLKGVGIFLVVLGHALGGLIDANVTPLIDWFRPLFAVIYMFHMPLFFFISGLFVSKRIYSSVSQFKKSLFNKIVWPYILWSVIQTLIIVFAGSIVNHPVDNLLENIAFIPFHPPSQFWFLYALFLMHLFTLLFLKNINKWLFIALGFCIFFLGTLDFLPYILNLTAKMFIYYVLGVVLGAEVIDYVTNEAKMSLMQVLIILFSPLLLIVSYKYAINLDGNPTWPNQAASIFHDVNNIFNFFAASAITLSLFIIAKSVVAFAPKWLIFIGKISMPIFILHVIFVAGFRIIILKYFPNTHPEILLVFLTFIGLLFPSIVYLLTEKLNISKFIGFN